MATSQDITIECPGCGSTYRARDEGNDLSLPDVTAAQTPSRTAPTATCPGCGHMLDLAELHADDDGVWRSAGRPEGFPPVPPHGAA